MKPRKAPRMMSCAGVRRVVHGAGRRCTPEYLDALNRMVLCQVLDHIAVTPYKTLGAGVVAAPVLSGLNLNDTQTDGEK